MVAVFTVFVSIFTSFSFFLIQLTHKFSSCLFNARACFGAGILFFPDVSLQIKVDLPILQNNRFLQNVFDFHASEWQPFKCRLEFQFSWFQTRGSAAGVVLTHNKILIVIRNIYLFRIFF
ncbi:predicted protein [Methanosarcina acetivorans C2A]|uniref:Uncharacterized protein n=1 Tax=Methanosarcina acetivorans (strain ATCC 35395 / DSM 2834 / JCM 12185 / C2A) TaxID=188937 RepID=Q8TU37_METAC|nr:predicted protein [Methanosarcina acetivorans C2A]